MRTFFLCIILAVVIVTLTVPMSANAKNPSPQFLIITSPFGGFSVIEFPVILFDSSSWFEMPIFGDNDDDEDDEEDEDDDDGDGKNLPPYTWDQIKAMYL